MEVFFGIVITILVLVIAFTIDKTVKYYRQKKLFEMVSYSAIGDYEPVLNRYSYTNDLVFEIRRAQHNNLIDDQYRINDDDFGLVKEIIEEYQKNITRLYFRDKLELIKSKYVISPTDYFMFNLFAFLSDNSCEHSFLGHNMRGERLEYKRYDDGSGFFAIDTMSEYAIIYYKLYYIAYMYCRHKVSLQSAVAPWAEEKIKEILDTKQIKIIG